MAYLRNYGDDWRRGYVDLCTEVTDHGRRRQSRNGSTYEMRDFMFVLAPDAIDLPLGVHRKMHLPLAAAEAIQLCAGVGMPELTEAVSKQIAQYVRDPDGTVHGNYGARVGTQIGDVIDKLMNDRDSRQAVIAIWSASADSRYRLPMPKDIPCTLSLTFHLTSTSQLEMSVVMRSSDVWLGIPYDVFQFRQLQRTIAQLLGSSVGSYTHHSVSMHAYEKDLYDISQLGIISDWECPAIMPWGLVAPRAKDLPEVMRDVLHGRSVISSSHRWYHEQLGEAYASIVG